MRAYERLLKYVKVWTTSDGSSGKHPSADREFDLARILVKELQDMGIKAEVDDKCYVYAVIPATKGYEDKTFGKLEVVEYLPSLLTVFIKREELSSVVLFLFLSSLPTNVCIEDILLYI